MMRRKVMPVHLIAYAAWLVVTDNLVETVLNKIETAVSHRLLCGGKS